ncbi:MAG: hypothetical protein LBT64_00670 [Puniceicoccales bacterium]|jgi:hypothetical protein|nr:hypothetical protein [Puniceicoccales bacterium]
MMKRKILILIALNIILLVVICHWFLKNYSTTERRNPADSLRGIDKICVQQLESGREFHLRKSQRTGAWNVAWGLNIWPANVYAIDQFCWKMQPYFLQALDKIQPQGDYEVTIFESGIPKSAKLSAEEMGSVFAQVGSADDANFYRIFLDNSIFAHVRSNCGIFKLKLNRGEFVFTRRHGKWSIGAPASNLHPNDELIAEFFREIFSLNGTVDPRQYENVMHPTLAITLYGGNSSERVKFLDVDGTICLAQNDAADLSFGIDREAFLRIENAIENLLKFNVFPSVDCEEISIVLQDSGEHFNFHDLRNHGPWQFTHSKNGELSVQEISREKVSEMVEFLKNTESLGIVHEMRDEIKCGSLSMIDGAGNQQIFNIHRNGNRIFIEPNEQDIRFEVRDDFLDMLFAKMGDIFHPKTEERPAEDSRSTATPEE